MLSVIILSNMSYAYDKIIFCTTKIVRPKLMLLTVLPPYCKMHKGNKHLNTLTDFFQHLNFKRDGKYLKCISVF